jgi:hypothetical protein
MHEPWILDIVYLCNVLRRLATLGAQDPLRHAGTDNKALWKGIAARLEIGNDLDHWFAQLTKRNLLAMRPISGGNGSVANQSGSDVAAQSAQLQRYLGSASASSMTDWEAIASEPAKEQLVRLIPTLAGGSVWPDAFDANQWMQLARPLHIKAGVGDVKGFFAVHNLDKMRKLTRLSPEELFAELLLEDVRQKLCGTLQCEPAKLVARWADEIRQSTRLEVAPNDILEAEDTKRRIIALVRSLVPAMTDALESTIDVVPTDWQYHHDLVALRLALSGDYRAAAKGLVTAAPELASQLSGDETAEREVLTGLARVLEGLQFDPISRKGEVDVSGAAVLDHDRRRPLLQLGRTSGIPQDIRRFVEQEGARMLQEDPQAIAV